MRIEYAMKKFGFALFCCLCLTAALCCGCSTQNKQVLSSYVLDVVFDENSNSLTCHQQVEYVNNSENALDEVCFFLYANAFDESESPVSNAYLTRAYPNGRSFGNIEIGSVQVENVETKIQLEENEILVVNLSEELFPQESVLIELEYVVNLANINHRLGYGNNAINFGNFFPIACVYDDGFVKNKFASNGDPFFSDVSNFEVTITCSEDFVVASSGQQIETKTESGKKITSCVAEKVRDFAFVLSKNFQVLTQNVDDIEVKYYFYQDDNAAEHLQTAVDALSTYQNLFGDYPYKQLSVVKTNFCFGGMEYPNLVMISDNISDDETINYVIAHEIAHQWWYGVVGSNEFEQPWVDEGLTEFSTALFFEENPKYGLEYDTIMENATNTYKNFVRIFSDIYGELDESMNRNLHEYPTEPEYVNCTYTKGMLLFDSLRQSMSDRKFFGCLKDYYKNFSLQNSSAEKLILSFSKSSHTNLESFFNSWLDGEVIFN